MLDTKHPVRMWRKRRKMKLIELAAQLEIPKSYMSEIECGRRRPGLDLAIRLSDLTNIPVRKIAEFAAP